MTSPVRALWDAPPASPAPPRRVWRDWALVGALAPLILVEASVRPDVAWRWVWAAVLIALLPTLLWRRVRPLTMLAIAFAIGAGARVATGSDSQLFATAYLLVLPYAVFRWGSGRAMVLGGALVAGGTVVSLTGAPPLGDVIGGIAVAIATAALALAFRWRAGSRARELDHVRLREREQLARDLHDTVAHHVSAIAVQAQAGTAVASVDPDAAAEALRAIEGEATRTLLEMRAMVGVLRRPGGETELAPTPGFTELRRLERSGGSGPAVSVRVEGDTATVPAPVAAVVFRLAQEAVTNARRHARNATCVDLVVRIEADGIRLDAHDDGPGAASAPPGFGIVGMRERAALLGGTLEAGPAPGGGWLVAAWLPRRKWAT